MNTQNLLKDSNTNWKYILIVIVLAFLVGGGILGYQYWWLPKQEVKMPEIEIPEKVVEDETVDWNIFVNTAIGYRLKYPDGVEVLSGCVDGMGVKITYYKPPELCESISLQPQPVYYTQGAASWRNEHQFP